MIFNTCLKNVQIKSGDLHYNNNLKKLRLRRLNDIYYLHIVKKSKGIKRKVRRSYNIEKMFQEEYLPHIQTLYLLLHNEYCIYH